MSHRIEVGEWRSGTHCVPAHQRTIMKKSIETHPPVCPEMKHEDSSKEEEKWHYNSHVMSRVFGQHQNEWMKRIMSGYGVQKMNFTHGVSNRNQVLVQKIKPFTLFVLIFAHSHIFAKTLCAITETREINRFRMREIKSPRKLVQIRFINRSEGIVDKSKENNFQF